LNENRLAQVEAGLTLMLRQQQTRNRWLGVLAVLLAGLIASQIWIGMT
jgi:ubiquinone biosynthesis protein